MLVVPDRDAGQRRLAGTDHVPAGRDQMDPVAERRQQQRAVRVVGHDRAAGERCAPEITQLLLPSASGSPLRLDVCATGGGRAELGGGLALRVEGHRLCTELGPDVLGTEPDRSARGLVSLEDGVGDERQVERRVGLQLGPTGVKVEELAALAQRPAGGRAGRIAPPASTLPIQPVVPRDDDLGRPPPGLDPQDSELERQPRRLSLGQLDVRVDPLDERPDDLGPARMIVIQLASHVAPELQQPRADVAGERPGPLDLGQRPRGPPSPELQLKEPVAGGRITLGEEQVVLVASIDMRDPPPIAQNFHGMLEALDDLLRLLRMGGGRHGDKRGHPRPRTEGPTSITHRAFPSSS